MHSTAPHRHHFAAKTDKRWHAIKKDSSRSVLELLIHQRKPAISASTIAATVPTECSNSDARIKNGGTEARDGDPDYPLGDDSMRELSGKFEEHSDKPFEEVHAVEEGGGPTAPQS